MNLKELIIDMNKDFNFDLFKKTFDENYLYENPMNHLKLLDAIPKMDVENHPNREIDLRFSRDFFDQENPYLYADVGMNELIRENKKHYSLSFIPIKEVAGYNVDSIVESFLNTGERSKEEIVAHILVEICFYGFDDETIQEQSNELKERIKKIESNKKDGIDNSNDFVTFEELQEKLEKWKRK